MWLDATTKTLEIILGESATTQLPYTIAYAEVAADNTASAPKSGDGASNSTTAVTVLAAPGSSLVRELLHFSINNVDNVTHIVKVRMNDNSTLRTMIRVSLLVNEQLVYSAGRGWYCLDAAGSVKTGATLPTLSASKVLYNDGSSTSWATFDQITPTQSGHTNQILVTSGSAVSWNTHFTVSPSTGNTDCGGTFLSEGAITGLAGLSLSLGDLVVQVGNAIIGGTLSAANGSFTVDLGGNMYIPANFNCGSLTGPSNILPLKDSGGVAAALEFLERASDPSAPASAKGILYCRDDGGGHIQLCFQAPTGSPLVICTEV